MAGIVRYGTYVPYFRLTRAAMGGGKGERAVASYDEDATSLGVEAAREALRGAPEVQQLLFATTNPAYAEKLNAATLHAACNLPASVAASDLGGKEKSRELLWTQGVSREFSHRPKEHDDHCPGNSSRKIWFSTCPQHAQCR